ncbi:MAG: DUF87 domain-containing protein [Nanoarchaeota archaeon]
MLGEKADKILFAYRMTGDKDKKFQIEQALHALYVKTFHTVQGDQVLLEPPQEGVVDGPYSFGTVMYAENELFPFGLRDRDFPRHICITGMSGSGKTNLGFNILNSLVQKNKPFIVFDWKSSFRPLMHLEPRIMLFTVGNDKIANHFRININRPPKGIMPKEWIGILADIINESFFASHGVHKLISEALDEAFKLYGVYKGSNVYPTWHQVKLILEDKQDEYKRGRESEWLASALRIAHSLTFGGFADTINAKEDGGFSVEDILAGKVIFELQALGASEKKFFCEYLLTYIYKLKKSNQEEHTSDFKSAIIVDEAHNIFLKDKPVFMKESIVDSMYREIREYGISMICMDQHISKLSEVVAGNSACNIAFQQMLPQDIQAVSGVMMMQEKKDYFSMLPVGSAIVRLAERHHRPFLITVPFIPLVKERFLDENLISRMDAISHEMRMQKIVLSCMDDGTTSHEIIIEKQEEDAEEKLIALKNRLEKKMEKEKEAAVHKIENQMKKQIDKVDFRLAGIGVRNPKEQTTDVKRKEFEAVDKIHGPKEFSVPHTVSKRKPLDQLSDEDYAREFKQKQEGIFTKQLKYNAQHIPITNSPVSQSTVSTPISQISHLTHNQTIFLGAVHANPHLTISQIYAHLSLSGRKGNRLKDELVALGLIDIREVRSEKGWKKYLILAPRSQAASAR